MKSDIFKVIASGKIVCQAIEKMKEKKERDEKATW
jgi:hypothetical protein